MRVLVIGRTGQLAQALNERGVVHGATVTLAGRPDTNLTAPPSLAHTLDTVSADVVINAAAYTAVDKAESEEAAAHALNAQGPGTLAALCAARERPLIHISTDYVFNGELDRPYEEDDATDPQSAYGRTKLAGEQAVADSGAQALIVRTAWVYSPFGTNFLKTMLRLGAERPELRVVADQHGNPTSAHDLADALLRLCALRARWPAQGDDAQTLHISGLGDASWHEFAKAIFQDANLHPNVEPIETKDFPTPAQRPRNSRLNCGFINERYAIAMPHWQSSVAKVVARLQDERQAEPSLSKGRAKAP